MAKNEKIFNFSNNKTIIEVSKKYVFKIFHVFIKITNSINTTNSTHHVSAYHQQDVK